MLIYIGQWPRNTRVFARIYNNNSLENVQLLDQKDVEICGLCKIYKSDLLLE